jgi:sugar phosphate isomerase/epimerase
MMHIGIDSFSYHRFFGDCTPWEQPVTARWQTDDFLARAAAHGVRDVSLQTVYLPPFDADSTTSLRAALRRYNLRPVLAWGHPAGLDGGTDQHKLDDLYRLLPWARELGCSILRIVCGNQFTYSQPVQPRIERLTPILTGVARQAADYGLTIAVENHADFRMRDLVTLIETVGEPNLGICLDSGNAVRAGDSLLEAADLAGPHVRMVHIKDLVVRDEWRGDPTLWWPSAPLGRGDFDVQEFLRRLAHHGYAGTLYIEFANLYPAWPNEDAAIAESIAYLRRFDSNLIDTN